MATTNLAINLIHDAPVSRPVDGHPLGNGRMGTLVWTTPGTIEMQINRVDVFAINRDTAAAHHPGPLDYGGGCARIRVDVGGETFCTNTDFRQELSLDTAEEQITGDGVAVRSFISAVDDLLVLEIDDRRAAPQPLRVDLSMWRPPVVTNNAHMARYAFECRPETVLITQTYTEGDYYCGSVVAVQVASSTVEQVADNCARLLLPAAGGARQIFVASAASWNAGVDLATAVNDILARNTGRTYDELLVPHAAWWANYHARTFVTITSPDGRGEQAARDRALFLYHMAATSRGALPPKWNGSIFLTNGDARDWGAQFWLWTTEMLYWPLHAADASDLADPFFAMYRRQLPHLATAARQRWQADGIYLPETIPFDGPADLPEALVAEYQDRFLRWRDGTRISVALADRCAYDWHLETLHCDTAEKYQGYSWISHVASSAAELAVHAWWRYRYAGDTDWLRAYAYPLLRGVAEFYRSLVRRGEDGCLHLHGTNAHEDFWGVTDSIMDLAAIRGTAPLAICAAERLDVDGELRASWQTLLDELAPYPMGRDPRAQALAGGALADDAWAAGYRGVIDGSHNSEDVQLTPIFPFEDWTLATRDAQMATVACRTLACVPRHRQVLDGAELPTAIRSPIAAVRAGAGEALPVILARYRTAFAPLANGFSLFEQGTPGSQAHSIEHLGLLTMILQEALLQSVAPRPSEPEIIYVFPAWPRAWDAEFRLLARGGFMVAAGMRDGVTQSIEIESRRGEVCRVYNPWACSCLLREADGVPRCLDGDVLIFDTQVGKRYTLAIDHG